MDFLTHCKSRKEVSEMDTTVIISALGVFGALAGMAILIFKRVSPIITAAGCDTRMPDRTHPSFQGNNRNISFRSRRILYLVFPGIPAGQHLR